MAPAILKSARVAQTSTYRWIAVPMDHAKVKAVRVMAGRVLATYGVSPTGPRTPIMRALRDFVARIAIHPHPPLHPDGSTFGLTSLPAGETWATFNATLNAAGRTTTDNNWWNALGQDSLAKFETLFGTINAGDGSLSGGMVTEYASGRWRINSLASFKGVQCTHQDQILAVLAAAYGCVATIVSTIGHDGCAVYVPDSAYTNYSTLNAAQDGWMWCDLTYNECYQLDGAGLYLSPLDLHYYSLAGQTARLICDNMAGPAHDPLPYVAHNRATDSTYFNTSGNHPNGMSVTGTFVNLGSFFQGGSATTRLVQIPAAALAANPPFNSATSYPRVPAEVAYPDFGVAVTDWQPTPTGVSFRLIDTWPGPGTHTLQRRINNGAWADLADWGDTLGTGQGIAEYRVKDAEGFYSSTAVISV